MKIKRWTVYDGLSGSYVTQRYFWRKSAEAARDQILFEYGWFDLTLDEMDSVKVVELA